MIFFSIRRFLCITLLCCLAQPTCQLNCWNNVGRYDATGGSENNLRDVANQRAAMIKNIDAAEDAAQALQEVLLQAHSDQRLSDDDLKTVNRLHRDARESAVQARSILKHGAADDASIRISRLNDLVGQMEAFYKNL